ncbi:MAG TPA: ATP-binding protein [Kofleriaceae bacterium]|jgi:light-regulated signal transduction histidine kinase (bacteriophytochrome)
MMNDPKRAQLAHEYVMALRECITGGGEASLAHAYELGRIAAGSGIGVVELETMHATSLRELLGTEAPPPQLDQFFAEALAPFEMTHRGFREANQKLEATVRELEAFSYSVSHDLRAPLRTISAFTQALAEDLRYSLDDKARDHLRRVLAAAARMSDLIDALLELSQISRVPLGRHRVDFSALATAALDELKRRDASRRIVGSIAPGMFVEADARLVRILLDNLLANAVKFTLKQACARIEVGCEDREGEAVYYVRDNGIGIEMSQVDRLFKPFQRLHSEREYAGTGIGLATVQRIVDRHGGRIWCESQVSRGATFHFTLPSH